MIIRNDNIQEANLLNLVGGEGIDTNASSYLSSVISAGGLVDSTTVQAVNTLFTSLKSSNLYNKLIIMYPFVGGVGAAHSINALKPGTNDLFFRNKTSIPWVHTTTGSYNTESGSRQDGNWATVGSQYNGTLAGQGVLNPTGKSPGSIFVSAADMSASVYSRGKLGRGTGGDTPAIFGVAEGGDNRFQLILRAGSTDVSYCIFPSVSATYQFEDTNSTGYYIMTRTSSSSFSLYKSGSVVFTATQDVTCLLDPDSPLYINCGATTDTIEYSFLHFGTGLNGTQSTDLNNIVQTFQTSLGRQV
jgi:hypothetical protein